MCRALHGWAYGTYRTHQGLSNVPTYASRVRWYEALLTGAVVNDNGNDVTAAYIIESRSTTEPVAGVALYRPAWRLLLSSPAKRTRRNTFQVFRRTRRVGYRKRDTLYFRIHVNAAKIRIVLGFYITKYLYFYILRCSVSGYAYFSLLNVPGSTKNRFHLISVPGWTLVICDVCSTGSRFSIVMRIYPSQSACAVFHFPGVNVPRFLFL